MFASSKKRRLLNTVEVYTCLSVSHAVHREGISVSVPGADTPPEQTAPLGRYPLGRHPSRSRPPHGQRPPRSRPPHGQTPPRSRPLGADSPQADTPLEQTPPRPAQCMLGDMGNKRAVRILLECILVLFFILPSD